MRLGTILLCRDDVTQFTCEAALAEELGYGLIGVGDVPMYYRELYSALAIAAGVTTSVLVGPMVTNPVSRHPAVTASAISTLAALSGGRAVLGFGAGGGPLLSIGQAIPRLRELRDAVVTIRQLLHGLPSSWEGRPLSFVPAGGVPLLLAAYGPRTARVAGEVADGVILAGGVSDDVLTRLIGEVHAGAAAAGRSPSDIDLWVMARAAVAGERDEAIGGIKANLASAGSHGLRSTSQLAGVPEPHRSALVELQERYDQSEHVKWDGENARLIDELGLTDYLAARFAIAGAPADVREQVERLAGFGVSTLVVPAVDREPARFLEAFAAAVGGGATVARRAGEVGP